MIRLRGRAPTLDDARYVPAFVDRSTEIYNLDGVPWHEAELPPKRHRCWPQTWGYTSWFSYVERCACGAIRTRPGERWFDKNQTRQARLAETGRLKDAGGRRQETG